jgi:low affinity Fe/Cu permease
MDAFRRFAHRCSSLVGTPLSFGLALLLVVVWAATGPLFHFSDTWQLVINTGTTVVTFLMVFLIQATQNRDAQSIHLKLDELIRANRNARNLLAGIENCSEEELQALQQEFERLRLARPPDQPRHRPSPSNR